MFPHTGTASLRGALLFSHCVSHTAREKQTSDTNTERQPDRHTSLHRSKHKRTHAQSFSNKHGLFHRCTDSVRCCIWHELNMPWFQAQLPVVVVCAVTAGKYPQRSSSNAYVFPLSDFTLTKGFYQPHSPAVYTCHTGKGKY